MNTLTTKTKLELTRPTTFTIFPYWSKKFNSWVFDDAAKNLKAEPFLLGMPEIILAHLSWEQISRITAMTCGFELTFSNYPFELCHALYKIGEMNGGCWYCYQRLGEHKMYGWLCQELYQYFDTPPFVIYFKTTPVANKHD